VTKEVFNNLSNAIEEQRALTIYSPGMDASEYALRACYAEAFVVGANAFAEAYNALEFSKDDSDE
jgi:hypothetical protein